MKKLKALQILQKSDKKIFTLQDIKKLLEIKKDNTAYKQIEGLVKEGVLTRAKRGVYFLTDNPPSNFELANALYQPSYISLESALAHYGILIQLPQVVTSVTTKTANKFVAKNMDFTYSHIDPEYFGYYIKEDNYQIATPEKALVDTMFFASLGKGALTIEELVLAEIDNNKLKRIAGEIEHSAFHKYFNELDL